mmetsp:Transcript_205/g.501  ORF Transcript_205/g.501 Transcript_205/m.501 type:complete len:195 (+) Transcript_205:117-701(+)
MTTYPNTSPNGGAPNQQQQQQQQHPQYQQQDYQQQQGMERKDGGEEVMGGYGAHPNQAAYGHNPMAYAPQPPTQQHQPPFHQSSSLQQPLYSQHPQAPYPAPGHHAPPPRPVVLTNPVLTHGPQTMTCPHCHHVVVTRTSYEVGLTTWVVSGAICLVGCFAGCCLLPFCVNEAKDCNHYCPQCHQFIGSHRHLS